MQQVDELPKSYRRDIELILLGMAIAKGERERVLAMLPDNLFSSEVGVLIGALRSGQPQALRNWLECRGVVFDRGRDVVDASAACLVEHNERERLRSIIQGLTFAAKGLSTSELKAQVLLSLKQVEEMS